MKNIIASLTAVAGAVLSLSSSKAGVIVIADLTNNESQIVNTGGTVVSAVNFGSIAGGTSTVDINGLVHQVSSTNNGASLDLVSTLVSGNFTFLGNFRFGAAATAGLSGDLQNLVGGIGGSNQANLQMNVLGLTPGTQYLFQTYWEATDQPELTITFEGADTQNFLNSSSAKLISYTFTASDDTLNVVFDDVPSDDNVWLSGYSLQTVPEPSALLLSMLGSLFFLRRRR